MVDVGWRWCSLLCSCCVEGGCRVTTFSLLSLSVRSQSVSVCLRGCGCRVTGLSAE